MTISALLMSLALVSPQVQTVNYQTSGTNLANILAEASKGWEKPLESSPELSQEILVVRAKDMPTQQFMDEIAFVTGGKWNDVGVKVILNLDTDAVKRYEQEKLEKRSKSLAKAREAKRTERSELFKDWTEEDKQAMVDDADFQMTWMLDDLLLRIPDRSLLQMKPGDRVVYSSSPNQMQRAMPAVNWNVFAPLIVKAANDRVQMYEEMMKENQDDSFMAMLPPSMLDMMMPKKFVGEPTLALLIHEIPKDSDEIEDFGTFTFVVFDGNGNNRFSVDTQFGTSSREMTMGVVYDEDGNPVEPPKQERQTRPKPYPEMTVDAEAIEPSETQQKLSKFRTTLRDFNVNEVDEDTRKIMRDVDIYEPLSWDIGEQLRIAAEKRNENLISLVGDDEMGSMFEDSSSNVTVGSMIESQFNDDLETPQTLWYRNKTFIARPSDIHETRKLRVNRSALANLMRSIETRTVPDVDLVANYYASNENAFDSQFSQSVLMSVAPQYSEMGEFFGNMTFMPIYAFLSQGQRDALKNGDRLPFGSIGGKARTKLTEMLFGASPKLTVMNPDDPMKNPLDRMMEQSFGMFGAMGGMFGGGGPAGVKTEPTLVMPNGLPAQGGIVSKANREGYLVQVDKTGKPTPMSVPMGAMEVSMFSMIMDIAQNEGENTEGIPTFDRMLFGYQTRADIRIYVAEDVVASHTFQWLDQPQKGSFFSMKNPPAEMQNAINAMGEQMKKSTFFQMMTMGMSRMRETPPPPPPAN